MITFSRCQGSYEHSDLMNAAGRLNMQLFLMLP
jgi:hypothetical protein